MTTVTWTASSSWTVPAGVPTIDCQCWGEGGSGGSGFKNVHSGGGGGGGEYAEETALAVTPGNVINFTIGAGNSATSTSFPGTSVTVTAHGGQNAAGGSQGSGGSGSTNSIHYTGDAGQSGVSGAGTRTGGTGGNGAGSGGVSTGGAGGTGGVATGSGNAGTPPGGGGGGGGSSSVGQGGGGGGAHGQITITYGSTISGTATLAGVGTLTASGTAAAPGIVPSLQVLPTPGWKRRFQFGRRQVLPGKPVQTISGTAALAGTGTLTAFGALPNPVVVNQWAASYGQGTTFASITSAVQSAVVSLTPSGSAGPGSGTPTAGNWLFTIASWTQDPQIAQVHVGVGDDIHSWWREFPASQGSGNVRTSISYTPNIARAPANVYVAPDMEIAAINVLVVEISGLNPWDTLTGTISGYTTGTSLSLALGASGSQSFTIAGFGGDNTSSGQAFLPAGWQSLATLTQTNGANHLADNIMTSAFLPSTNGSLNVSAGTSSSEDISGFMLQVQVTGNTPSFPSNANWPKFTVEAGFGSGFNTPDSEVTWTDITTRVWSADETTGIQFQLGEMQATNLVMELDNFDGALIPPAPGAPWSFTASGTPSTHGFFTVTTAQSASIQAGDGFTDTLNSGTLFTVTSLGAPSGGLVNVSFTPAATTVMSSADAVTQINPVAGTPVRIRAALGTLGGVTSNRWYMLQRNVMQWEERINEDFRRFISATLTDVWAVLSSTPPSFYRSEIYEDNPYAWYPLDDQPGASGVLPKQMLNAAIGNTNVLNVTVSPNGTGPTNPYGTDGTNLFGFLSGVQRFATPLSSYTTGASSGWMFGDPPGASTSLATGNQVTPNPGSAAWQTMGQTGNAGGNGWFLSVRDTGFPALSGGITVTGWFNYPYFGSTTAVQSLTYHVVAQQPYCPLTLMSLTTDTAPVAVLQMDINGHLSLITYNGTTGTSNSIYSASDLRSNTWFSVTMTLTQTAWTVYVNGSATAQVSGTATGMTSNWTYLIVNGDMGTSGGGTTANIQHSGNASFSHIQVFPYVLPYYRVMDHYWAAVTGFGQLPAPNAVAVTPVQFPTNQVPTVTPDGQFMNQSGGYGASPGTFQGATEYTMSGVIVAQVAQYTSGGSAYATGSGIPQVNIIGVGDNIALSWTGLAASFAVYDSTQVGNEVQAAITIAVSDVFRNGYGAASLPFGIGNLSTGSGGSVPAASQIGDTVGQRIERLMRAGRAATPNRCIDPAPLPVQAPGTAGGSTQVGAMIQQLQQSDGGMLYVDNVGHLTYWQRPHLAGQYSSPVWTLTPNAPPTSGAPLSAIPYYRDVQWVTDPQRIWNNIIIQPFDPTGAQLPLITPTDAAGVNASQVRYGAQPLNITSWLQSTSEMQSQAIWLFQNFGQPARRAEQVKIDAAPYPAAWQMIMGVNIGDVVTVENWQIGGGGNVNTFRVTEIHREIHFGGKNNGDVTAQIVLTCDFEPTSYWT